MIRFFTFSQFHNKIPPVGSTKIRVDNLLKYWPEAKLYRYGEKPDVMVFQKVYVTYDYKFIQHFEGIKILDICDPDWKDTPDILIKETLDAVDAVVTSSEALRDYLQQMTDTRCLVIKDRFDLNDFPKPKKHFSEAKGAGWFGYAHNALSLRLAVPSLEHRNMELVIVANENPAAWRWAHKPEEYKKHYTYIKYEDDMQARTALQQADLVIFPQGIRPFDRFKSENKTVIAELCGLPVVRNTDELDAMKSGLARQKHIDGVYNKLRKAYDVKLSVNEYKELIGEIKRSKA